MLKDHSLRVERSLIVKDVNTGPFLQELLSSHVLVEWQPSPKSKPDRYILAFSHNMLFDYAISRLIFGGKPARLVKKLKEDHELVLAVRPSIVYHFHDLWFRDQAHERFWDAVSELMEENQVPLIGKLIGPSVAVDLASASNDYDLVYSKLESDDPSENQMAHKIIRDTTGALLTFLPDGGVSDGKLLSLWGQFIERISRSMSMQTAYSVRAVLIKVCEQPKWLSLEQKKVLGKAARRLLEFAWSKVGVDRDQGLVVHALKVVCRTYESDPAASKTLIQQSLDPDHLAKYGFQEMPRLTDEIEWLIANDPDLTKEVYRKVFTHKEPSEETTSMGGRILGLLSTRRQDYHMAQWRLAEFYQFFIDRSPIEAIRALIDIIQNYVPDRHPVKDQNIATFILGEVEARIATDYSVIWDSGSVHDGDEPVKMLNIFSAYLQGIASNLENIELLKKIVLVIAQQNQSAVIWKKLLFTASSAPASLGVLIRSMAWSKPVLIGYDTTTAAGNFIRAIYDYLELEEKVKVEEAIISIAQDIPEDKNPEFAEHNRNRLLGCIVDKDLVLEETKKIAEYLKENNAVPPNSPLFSIETSWSKAYTEEDFLEEQSVSLVTPEHKRILELQNPLKEFASKYQNTSPALSDANEILPALLGMENALQTDADKIDPHVKDLAWGYLAQACERIATIASLDCKTQLGGDVKRLFFTLANYPVPTPDPEQDAPFSKFQAWGSPSPRIEAASGLILLAHLPNCCDEEILGRVQGLAKDSVPAVRFQIAVRLNVLLKTAPDLMWSLLAFYATEEINNGVIKGCLNVLHRLAGAYPDEVVRLASLIYRRTTDVEGTDSIAQAYLSIFLGLYLWRDHSEAGEQINRLLNQKNSPLSNRVHIVTEIRDAISEYKNDSVRLRAVSILSKIVQACVDDYLQIQEHLPLQDPNDIERFKEIVQLADSAAMTIYFSSGAFAEKESQKSRGKILSIDEKRIFFNEISSVIKSLSQITYPSITHHLIETLEALVPANPPEVFLLVGHAVKFGKSGGYQYESLAVDHIVQIVERYLAEYRLVIRENPECQRALLEILDIFVEAGWPNARKLTYRLEEIYR